MCDSSESITRKKLTLLVEFFNACLKFSPSSRLHSHSKQANERWHCRRVMNHTAWPAIGRQHYSLRTASSKYRNIEVGFECKRHSVFPNFNLHYRLQLKAFNSHFIRTVNIQTQHWTLREIIWSNASESIHPPCFSRHRCPPAKQRAQKRRWCNFFLPFVYFWQFLFFNFFSITFIFQLVFSLMKFIWKHWRLIFYFNVYKIANFVECTTNLNSIRVRICKR